MDKETLIRIAEELHQGAFDAKAYYLIMQQYRKNQHNYAEEMKVSPAFYHTVYDALMKACFVEIAKLYDSSNGVVSIGTLLAKCEENQDLFPKYRETLTVDHDGTTFSYPVPYQHQLKPQEECFFKNRVEADRKLFAAADNPVAGCSWKLSEISQNEFVLTEQAMSYRKILNETLASQSLEIRPVLEIGNPLQICELVKNRSLLSYLPDFISENYVKDGQNKRLDVAGCPVTVWTQLLLHKNKWRSPAINVFIEFYKEVMQR